MVYTLYDRLVVGGAMPVNEVLTLETIDPLKSPFFLSRREFGTYNVGGSGKVKVDGVVFELNYKEALYLGAGDRTVTSKVWMRQILPNSILIPLQPIKLSRS